MILHLLGRHDEDCEELKCKQQRLEEADRRLHEQATRLHVLEWEAYGHRKPRTPERSDH